MGTVISTDCVRVFVPVRLSSPNQWKNDRGRARRLVRRTVALTLLGLGRWRPALVSESDQRAKSWEIGQPLGIISLCRIGPRPIDGHDNLPAACKPVVDEIASWLALDDDRELGRRVVYSQRKPEKNAGNRYGLEITLGG